MRNYSKVGGQKGKPGYRTPRSFLNKFVEIAGKNSRREFYEKIKGYFAKEKRE